MDNRNILTLKMLIAGLAIATGVTDMMTGDIPAAVSDILWFFKVLFIILIIREGNVFSIRIYRTLLMLCMTVVMLGSLLKIMHWYGGDPALVAGLGAPALVYTIRFLLKPNKKILDVAKWLYVSAVLISSLCHLLHLASQEVYFTITSVSFVFLAGSYQYHLVQQRHAVMSDTAV